MRVIVAKSAGFCWGVRRAMDAALQSTARWGTNAPVQTLGPVIHNPQALNLLARRGVRTVDSAQDVFDGTVVIRAHGIPIDELRSLQQRRRQRTLRIINGTCPEVAAVQSKIRKFAARGYYTIILGTVGHPEAMAHISYASAGCVLISSLAQAQGIPIESLGRVLIVAQTTFTVADFQAITEHIQSRTKNCIVFNTICKDTWIRQQEADSVARRADAVVVIGGKTSNNTRHLAEVCRRIGKPCQFVETASELDLPALKDIRTVGVLAGASTPNWLVDEVVDVLEQMGTRPKLTERAHALASQVSLYQAAGGGLLTLGLQRLLGQPLDTALAVCTAAFLASQNLLLPFLDPLGLGTKGPARARFLERHRTLLTCSGSMLLVLALILAALKGWPTGLALASTSLFGLVSRRRFQIAGRTWALSNLPASRNLWEGMALMLVAALPSLLGAPPSRPLALLALFWAFALGFVRSSVHSILDVQNDHILDRDVLPMALGRTPARLLLGCIGIALAILAWFSSPSWPLGQRLLLLTLCTASFGLPLAYLWWVHDRFSTSHRRQGLGLDLSLAMSGLLVFM